VSRCVSGGVSGGVAAASTCGAVLAPRALTRMAQPPVYSPHPTPTPSTDVPPRLLWDRENIRKHQLDHKLDGVNIFEGDGQCMPLLQLESGKGWKVSLEEYVVGVEKRASLRELNDLFGERWPLLGQKDENHWRQGRLYPFHSPIYRASAHDFKERGAAVGADEIVKRLKKKYNKEVGRSAKAVRARANKEYPETKN